MFAKLVDFSELSKLLSVKSKVSADLLSLFGRFGLGNLLRRLSLEKHDGISAVQLILSLCLSGGRRMRRLFAWFDAKKREKMSVNKPLPIPETSKPDIMLLLQQLLEKKEHLNQENKRELFEYMNATNPDFMIKLAALGKFSNNEKIVFTLRKMGFTPSEIATLAGIASQTVSSIRSRAYEKTTKEKGSSEKMDELIVKL